MEPFPEELNRKMNLSEWTLKLDKHILLNPEFFEDVKKDFIESYKNSSKLRKNFHSEFLPKLDSELGFPSSKEFYNYDNFFKDHDYPQFDLANSYFYNEDLNLFKKNNPSLNKDKKKNQDINNQKEKLDKNINNTDSNYDEDKSNEKDDNNIKNNSNKNIIKNSVKNNSEYYQNREKKDNNKESINNNKKLFRKKLYNIDNNIKEEKNKNNIFDNNEQNIEYKNENESNKKGKGLYLSRRFKNIEKKKPIKKLKY